LQHRWPEEARKETDEAVRKEMINVRLVSVLAQPILDAITHRENKTDECLTYTFTLNDILYREWLRVHAGIDDITPTLQHILEEQHKFKLKRMKKHWNGHVCLTGSGVCSIQYDIVAEVCW
jgi:hypothetical protein